MVKIGVNIICKMGKYNTKDALGNEIVFGEKYGYTGTYDGITIIKIGVAMHFTEKGLLTIDVLQHKRASYNDEAQEVSIGPKVSVKPCGLFPVPNFK